MRANRSLAILERDLIFFSDEQVSAARARTHFSAPLSTYFAFQIRKYPRGASDFTPVRERAFLYSLLRRRSTRASFYLPSRNLIGRVAFSPCNAPGRAIRRCSPGYKSDACRRPLCRSTQEYLSSELERLSTIYVSWLLAVAIIHEARDAQRPARVVSLWNTGASKF